MLASAFVVKEEISVKFMRWKNFEGLFCRFFSISRTIERWTKNTLLFLSILKEVNWFPVRFSTVINGSLFFSVQGPRCQKYLTISFSFFPAVFMSNFCQFFRIRIPKFSFAVFWFLKVEDKVKDISWFRSINDNYYLMSYDLLILLK